MSDSLVLVRWQGTTCHLQFNRPARGNAFSAQMILAVEAALDAAETSGAAAILFEGAGKHFCTGFDLADLDSETDDTLLARFVRIELLLQRIARMRMVTMALAHGRVMGAGSDLFAACALRAARADTSFAFPGAKGFGLALGSRRLAACIGTARAQDWIASARAVGLDEALQAGLVNASPEQLADPQRSLDDARDRLPMPNPWVREALTGNARSEDASDLWALTRSAAQPGLKARVLAYVRGRQA